MKAIHKEKILELREKGLSYDQIQRELGCSALVGGLFLWIKHLLEDLFGD